MSEPHQLSGPVDPATFEVLRHRLWTINEEAAVTIARVSGSPIAVEGNDFNSGLLTAQGEVAVAGVYVLVHAVALGQITRHIIERYSESPGFGPGDMFITNDTYIGAPHQPDVVLLAPIFAGDRLIAWCGCCVHQADVGGPVPGSISVGARSIYEEAVPMAPMRIVEAGKLRNDLVDEYLIRSRRPELNRLDLLGQVAANRMQTERVLEICDRYGVDTLTESLTHLIDTTERRFRARLAALPDGRWRHLGLCEHDGIDDIVYRIPCASTKRGDSIELDFRGASPQAPALIDTSRAITTAYSAAALMTVLGYGLPWSPAAFERAMSIATDEGSIVDCTWPAGMSMGVTAAGQEIRTAVNICLSRLLDASDDPRHQRQALASSVSSSATQTLFGNHADGRPFGTMLLDGLPGGAGARTFADGPDTAGYLTSPSGACTNIETNELHYPQLYHWRRERADSGGPGIHRGGVGIGQSWELHHSGGPADTTVFGHGQQPPTSSGVGGGEPGSQHVYAFTRADGRHEPQPAKYVTTLGPGDLYRNWCAGGGGMGDPLERPAELVALDVANGLVFVVGAERDYGVVLRDGQPDDAATTAARLAHRRARLGGREPLAPRTAPVPGTRRSGQLVTAGGRFRCTRCGDDLGDENANPKLSMARLDVPVDAREPLAGREPTHVRFEVRHFHCPGCARQLDVEVNEVGAPVVRSLELLEDVSHEPHTPTDQ